MAIVLGYDGKIAALQASTGQAVSNLGAIYIGLLASVPANSDAASLATIVSTELNVTSFYDPDTDRKVIPSFSSITSDENGAIISNTGADIQWTNSNASAQTVGGFFITNSSAPANDTGAKILWVGTPSIGSLEFQNGESVTIQAGDLTLKID